MRSTRKLWWACGALLVAALAVIACLAAAGYWTLADPPELRQALRQILATNTPTAIPSPTPTFTVTPTPTYTPTPSATPTVTPVLLDLPSPSPTATARPATPSVAPSATATTAPPTPRAQVAAATAAPPPPTATQPSPPTPTAPPTIAAEPFLPIGSRAVLSPQSNGVLGTAVLFSGREITMIDFSYDGQCPIADIRLSHKGFPKPPTAVLLYLEPRAYKEESIAVPIPDDVAPGTADAIFVYCDTRDDMMAWGELMAPR